LALRRQRARRRKIRRIASLVATCKDNQVDFKAWLEDVLTRLGTTRHDDIDSLLPHNWTPARN